MNAAGEEPPLDTHLVLDKLYDITLSTSIHEILKLCLLLFLMYSGGAYPSASTSGLDASNKGHQLLQKMGWQAGGLGASGQGIAEPISGGIVRDRQDQYKGKYNSFTNN